MAEKAPEFPQITHAPRDTRPLTLLHWISDFSRSLLYILTPLTRRANGGLQYEGFTTPPQITSDQNDYNPTTLQGWRLSSDASRNITGIANGAAAICRIIVNVGANNIVLVNQSGSSVAGNRIITGTGANVTLQADDIAVLLYDEVSERWRILSVR